VSSLEPVPTFQKRSDWEKKAGKYSGMVVAWINQSKVNRIGNLKGSNTTGVCWAILIDWIKAAGAGSVARNLFVGKFKAPDNDENHVSRKEDCFIPDYYLTKQAELAAEYRSRRAAADSLDLIGEKYADTKPPNKAAYVKACKDTQKVVNLLVEGGEDALTLEYFDPKQVPRTLKNPKSPTYFAIGMRAPKAVIGMPPAPGSHIIGFEFRPDLFSGYSFLDANLGLFQFLNWDDAVKFWLEQVHPAYVGVGYVSFGLITYPPIPQS
jgi:hypothetical protein